MEATKDRPPEYVAQSPESVTWPAVPQHVPSQSPPSGITLPGLKTVLSPDFEPLSPRQSSIGSPHNRSGSRNSIRSLPRIDPGNGGFNQDMRRSMDAVMASPVETGSIMSMEEKIVRSPSVSMDDPDVRIAAEALSGLGNPDYARASHAQGMHMSSSHASPAMGTSDGAREPEPLLELVSQAHPWVGGAIKGSLTAYSTTKYYSPRIVQYGVGFAERNVGMPFVNAVGNVSAYTGVEAGLRRHLDSRRQIDIERGGGKESDSPIIIDERDGGMRSMSRQGFEQLPAYGASRPPSYREEQSPASADRAQLSLQERPPHGRSWSSHIVYSASGLSVALSTTSRQSLRFCLRLLAQQTGNVTDLTKALSMALSDYEEARQKVNTDSAMEKGERPATPDRDQRARELAGLIRERCDQIWQSLRYVVTTVSNSAGGALPQNAREFVRVQLMSLPQRWRVVSDAISSESETARAAQRMIDFAGQGLDMMAQVSGALQATLESAEKWLAAVNRRDIQEEDEVMQDAHPQPGNEKS